MLDEPNYSDGDVAFCMQVAKERGDYEGYALAEILMRMSKTQRSKIGVMAERIHGDRPFRVTGGDENSQGSDLGSRLRGLFSTSAIRKS